MGIDLERALAIQGWMSEDELLWLAKLATPATTIVEVGSWKGRSTRAIADHMDGMVYVVDNWCEASESADLRNEDLNARGSASIEAEWRENLSDHLASGKVQLIRGHSPEMAAIVQLQTGGVDFAFIDADHSFRGVIRDIRAYKPVVRPGGILAGHDYTTASHPDVKEAVDLMFGSDVQRGAGSIWWVAL